MKLSTIALLVAWIAGAPALVADSIRVEHGYIEISVERSEQRYRIGASSFKSASDAASFLAYLDQKWPGEERPTIVVEDRDKAAQKGDEVFGAALAKLEASARWKVIRMPSPRSAIPDSWTTLADLRKEWAEQGGAGQPATAPESKPEGKDKPQPEKEPAPR